MSRAPPYPAVKNVSHPNAGASGHRLILSRRAGRGLLGNASPCLAPPARMCSPRVPLFSRAPATRHAAPLLRIAAAGRRPTPNGARDLLWCARETPLSTARVGHPPSHTPILLAALRVCRGSRRRPRPQPRTPGVGLSYRPHIAIFLAFSTFSVSQL